jgi:hypothetical protein
MTSSKKGNSPRRQLFAKHLQNKPQETLAKNHIDRIIRGPQSPRRRKMDRRDPELKLHRGVDGREKRCRMGGSPRTKGSGGDREIGGK